MYLTEILIENAGPILRLDLTLPLKGDGNPKPVILVGGNGSGKTILEATIADALILMATPHFQDVVPHIGLGHAYFKISGGINQRVGTSYSLSVLAFKDGDKTGTYVDKTGTLATADIAASLQARFPGVAWPDADNHKNFVGFSKEEVIRIYSHSALCFFPSTRREFPHWLNLEALNEKPDREPVLGDALRFSGRLGKPVFVERSRERNKQWILDVLFDSRTEIQRHGEQVVTAPYDNLENRLFLTVARENVDAILRAVMDIPNVRIHGEYRGRGSRLSIARGADIIIPSLDNLSLGQSLLFNLFCTVVRYADTYDLQKGHDLSQIEGIVVIDEVDAHLHADLQFATLPRLIKLFPKVQFILSTHAPMFLLGMEREFGEDGFAVYELPSGEQISTERFSEFQRSLDYYKQTKAFEAAVSQKLLASAKPTVLTEGDTDRDYIRRSLEVANRSDLLATLDIDWVGNNVAGAGQGGGTGSLDTVAKAFRANTNLLSKKLLLVYDCDANKSPETISEKLYIRKIPHNPANGRFTRGIENLLPETLARTEFYDVRTDNKYGGRIETLNKRKLCDWVVAQNDPTLFAGFAPVVAILDEFVSEQVAPTHANDAVEGNAAATGVQS